LVCSMACCSMATPFSRICRWSPSRAAS
jgi:hypothetical protein